MMALSMILARPVVMGVLRSIAASIALGSVGRFRQGRETSPGRLAGRRSGLLSGR